MMAGHEGGPAREGLQSERGQAVGPEAQVKVMDSRYRICREVARGGVGVVHGCGGRSQDAQVRARAPRGQSQKAHDRGEGRVTSALAMHRWLKTARGVRAAGLQFVDLGQDTRDEINRYVSLMESPMRS